MRKIRLVFYFSFICLSAVAQKDLSTEDEEKIFQNFKNQENCWNNKDIECYMQAYSKSEEIQTISSGGVTFGYENILSNYKKYFPEDKMGKLSFDNLCLRKLSEELCFVVGRFNLEFSNTREAHGWFSVVMKKEGREWSIITDHSS